jgi:LysR family glycine cleavage system transcriptional activator
VRLAPAPDFTQGGAMRRQIPSLSALESFEAVARLGTTTKAAEELGRTQSAVSRQILNLEALANKALFERSQSRLMLNAAGRNLFETVSRALDRLEYTLGRVSTLGNERPRIELRVWPTFGARWMVSRLARLPADNLGLDVGLSIDVEANIDLSSLGADAIILYGTGDWPALASYPLLAEELIAVASPTAVERLGHDVSAHPWLYMQPRPGAWRRWVRARTPPGTEIKDGATYQVSLLIEMACLGQGVAVLPRVYVERELASGQLVAPFGEALSTGRSYYLCYPIEDAAKPELVAFRDWLLSTC